MSNLWLVAQREYLVRVKKKTFILITLLTPLFFGLLGMVGGYLASKSTAADQRILIKDASGIYEKSTHKPSSMVLDFTNESQEYIKEKYLEEGYDLALYIPTMDDLSKKRHDIVYYSKEKLSLSLIESLERRIGNAFKDHKIENSNIDREVYNSFATNINMENGAKGDETSSGDTSGKLSSIIGTILGGLMGFLMYMVIFVYGGMVMRSVMEEKINRISEVMISSVRPFDLMLGKIIGVGGVGLTQLAIWLVLIPVVLTILNLIFGVDPSAAAASADLQELAAAAQESGDFNFNNFLAEFKAMNWLLIIPAFVMFFVGGYFIYSALFAAIGSAVGEDMGEAQQLMFPIIIPVILAFIMLQGVIANPNGSMAVFGSMFPLFSPIIMPARLPFDPPIWQVILSIIILIATCIFFAWLAGRIYRVGILMYGKKVNFKEISKWLFYKS